MILIYLLVSHVVPQSEVGPSVWLIFPPAPGPVTSAETNKCVNTEALKDNYFF